ncbi:transient receptor potential cation channel subfamily A member 1 [Halyomorpha halys]|uniref:transient receptor potential cation channel subfamily A member 1 n=1 Tax=Halyomorpha halys TaxID=286706 RepID=UPI0006D4E13C|nr:transient receptor potential cation channel subfamily A member 1 [Halyomorpha halys]
MADDQNRIYKLKRLNTRLLEAVYSKDLEKVKKLLASEAHPDTQCQVSLVSPVHIAAYHGSEGILKELLDKDVALTTRDIRGLQPHHLAVFKNEALPCLKIILDKQMDLIDSPVKLDQPKTTLRDELSDSYGHKHNDLTNLIREEIKEGVTALYIATKKGLTEVVEELLVRKATITEEILALSENQNAISIILNTAYRKQSKMGELQMAVYKGDVKKVNQCLEKIGLVSNQPEPTLLHLAVQNQLKKESNKDNYNDILVKLVETMQININHLDKNSNTPLYLATEGKWIDDIDWLLKNGADENIKCQKGETVFHLAARNKDYNVLTYLLKAKPGSDALKLADDEGYTPLYRAIKSGCADCVQALLETACDDDYILTLQDREFTILHAAIESSRNPDVILQKILEFLLMKNSQDSISVLNTINSEGLTAVDLAAKKGEVKCLDVLLKCDKINVIPTNIDKKENNGTALHHAAKKGYYVCLEKLLDRYEGLIDILDRNHLTALIYAARGGHYKCVKLLLKRGANLAIKDSSVNQTAVDIIMSNVPRAVEMIDDVLDSFIVPSKNVQEVEATTEDSAENNENIPDQEVHEPLINNINDEDNKSHDQVSIDMTNTDAPTTEENTKDNSVVPKKKDQRTKVSSIFFQKFKKKPKSKKQVTNLNTYSNEHYKINMVNLDYKCLVAGSRQLDVIEAVNECKYDKLKQTFFLHPLVKTFLIHKWKQINKIYLVLFFLYLIHSSSLTGFSLVTTVWQTFTGVSIIKYCCFILILLTIIPIILVEIVTWMLDAKIYSRSETYVKWTDISFTVLYCVITLFWQLNYHNLASVNVLFSWIKLLLFFAMRCNGGFYILLFFKIAKNVFQVLSVFFFLILGFSFAFFILFNGRKPFPDPFTAFGEVIAMISELNYDEAFENETDPFLITIGHVLFIVFYILVVMVMMNLIIGLSVNIVTEHEGKCKHLAMQGSFLSLVDKFCWKTDTNEFVNRLRDFFLTFNKQTKEKEKISSLNIFPNEPSKDNIFEKKLIFEVLERVNNKGKQFRPETMAQKMNKVGERVDEVLEIVHNRN